MAFELIFLDRAQNDLRELSPRAAGDYIDGLEKVCEKLRIFPNSGRQYDSKYRLLVYRNHLIFYRVSDASSSVHIVAIIDGRRDPSTFFQP